MNTKKNSSYFYGLCLLLWLYPICADGDVWIKKKRRTKERILFHLWFAWYMLVHIIKRYQCLWKTSKQCYEKFKIPTFNPKFRLQRPNHQNLIWKKKKNPIIQKIGYYQIRNNSFGRTVCSCAKNPLFMTVIIDDRRVQYKQITYLYVQYTNIWLTVATTQQLQ